MEIKPEWVSALSSFVGALAIVFVAIQSYLAKKQLDVATKQMEISAQHQKVAAEQLAISARQNEISTDHLKADHERSRRERAIDVLARWATTLDKAHPSARKLVESFDYD